MNESAALAAAPSRPWLSSAGPAFAQPSGSYGSSYGSGYGAGGPLELVHASCWCYAVLWSASPCSQHGLSIALVGKHSWWMMSI